MALTSLLDRLPDETTRHLVVLIQETGLRANDAWALVFNPVIVDSAGWPCLSSTTHWWRQFVPP